MNILVNEIGWFEIAACPIQTGCSELLNMGGKVQLDTSVTEMSNCMWFQPCKMRLVFLEKLQLCKRACRTTNFWKSLLAFRPCKPQASKRIWNTMRPIKAHPVQIQWPSLQDTLAVRCESWFLASCTMPKASIYHGRKEAKSCSASSHWCTWGCTCSTWNVPSQRETSRSTWNAPPQRETYPLQRETSPLNVRSSSHITNL